jgi:hypothetical protein
MEVAMQHLSHTPQSLRELIPTIPTPVEQVVVKALAKDPQDRFASIRDFAEELERASVSEITASAPPLVIEPYSSTETPPGLSDDSFSTLPNCTSDE